MKEKGAFGMDANEERWAGPPRPGMAQRDNPRSRAGAREGERSAPSDAGRAFFWLLSLSRAKRESNSP